MTSAGGAIAGGTTGSGGTAVGGSSGMGGAVGVDGAVTAGGATGAGGGSPIDANCSSSIISTVRQPADVLLVLDRSGSMNYRVSSDADCTGISGCIPRWSALTSAVTATLSDTAGSIAWGLKLFSSPGNALCGVDSGVEVPVSASSGPVITTQIASVSPGGNTPTAQAITAATAYLQTLTDHNTKSILLATDGEPNCGESGATTSNVVATIAAISAAKNASFRVYVIGIGPSVGNLDSFAVAGGTAHYYPATSSQSLASAFGSIGQGLAACTFSLGQTPSDPNNTAAYLDGKLVTKDDPNGWTFGAGGQSVVLVGTSCDAVTAGVAQEVRVLQLCPGEQPPPVWL
jgi:hypothetical protein